MWLNEVKVVLKDRVIPSARLCIENGVFTEIIETYGGAAPRFTVIPGLIDLHSDVLKRERAAGLDTRLPIESAVHDLDKRLAAAGITLSYTAVEFAPDPGDSSNHRFALDMLEKIQRCKDDLLTEMRVHGRFTLNSPSTLPLIHRLLESDRLHLLSLVNRTANREQSADLGQYWKSMSKWIDGTNKYSAEVHRMMPAEQLQPFDHKLNPHDLDDVRSVVAAASAYGVPVASHDDDTIQKIDMLAEAGVRISEFPVTMEAAARARARGMHVVMGAPNAYRGRSTRGNLSAQEAAQRGVLDTLATDYFPALLLQGAFKLVECSILSLPQSLNLISYNPAQAMGLRDRGHIAIGTQADFAVVEEGYVPRVRATYRSGRAIFSDGTLIPEMSAYEAAF